MASATEKRIGFPVAGRAWLVPAGIPAALIPALVLATSVLDLLAGGALLLRWQVRRIGALMLLMLLAYTAEIDPPRLSVRTMEDVVAANELLGRPKHVRIDVRRIFR